MKYTIIGILLFACITAYFSIYGERVPFERTQNEGWVISGGDSGTPIPHEGGEGQMDAFVFVQEMADTEQEQPTEATTEEAFPITVTVEQAKDNRTDGGMFFAGVAAGVLLAETLTTGLIVILYFTDKRKGKTK